MSQELPKYVPRLGWTCPPGYKHPKCSGCGHNYYNARPEPVDKHGSAVKSGLCEWCVTEQNS